jgi:hypothetical protein
MIGAETSVDGLLGFALPALIAIINQWRWPSPVKGGIAVLVCVGAATLAEWLRGPLNWVDWRSTVLVIGGTALASYTVFWRPSAIAPTIEQSTSVDSPTPGDPVR